MPDRISRALNRSGATPAVARETSKAFDRVWHAGSLLKLKSYGISSQVFGLISSFLSNRWLYMVLGGKSQKNIQLMLEFLKVSKVLANNADAEDNNSGLLKRGGIADLTLLKTLLVIHQRSQEPSFWKVMILLP